MKIRKPSPAMVVAITALFAALGGTSYATVSLAVPANSVGTTQLKDDSVTRGKIAHESITSKLVKNGSLYAVDFDARSLPVGPTGPAGPKGDRGDRGDKGDKGDTGATGVISRVTVRTQSVVVAGGGTASVTAACAASERASGGGTSWTLVGGESGAGLYTVSLAPSYDAWGATGYTARGDNTTGVAHTYTVSALCYPR